MKTLTSSQGRSPFEAGAGAASSARRRSRFWSLGLLALAGCAVFRYPEYDFSEHLYMEARQRQVQPWWNLNSPIEEATLIQRSCIGSWTDTPRYDVGHCRKESTDLLFLIRVTGTDSTTSQEVLDSIDLGALEAGCDVLLGGICMRWTRGARLRAILAEPDPEVIALVRTVSVPQHTAGHYGFRVLVLRAWRVDRAQGRFVTLPTKGFLCIEAWAPEFGELIGSSSGMAGAFSRVTASDTSPPTP